MPWSTAGDWTKKDQSWRFHNQYQTWFQRHEVMAMTLPHIESLNKAINDISPLSFDHETHLPIYLGR